MNAKKLSTLLLSAVGTCVAALGVVTLPTAEANIWSSSTGGAMCKGSSGLASAVTYYSNLYAQNTSSSGQYLTCGFTDVHAGNTATANQMWIGVGNPTAASITFNCAIQSGYQGGAGVVNTVVRNETIAANTDGWIYLNSSTIPPKGSEWSPYTLNCLVPAQGKIGLLTLDMPGTV